MEETVKFDLIQWHEKGKDLSGESVMQHKIARRGDEVDISGPEHKRLDALGAFLTDADRKAAEESAAGAEGDESPAVVVTEMDDQELMDWVKEVTIPEVLDAAADQPAVASRLLEAENAATGNDPRKGVVEALSAIAGRGE